ncbi:hypothetical protein, partial [Armatimonas sp.]|uniref:hypothetical protein n=1 Tax=Armatimonas sp. TaxID=1872638 RepID=UPI00286C1E23
MGSAKLDAEVIAQEWRGYWRTGISPLAGWLPERDKSWRATTAPQPLPEGHLAQGWPLFRILLFDPRLRETLLAVVGALDSAELEAWWLEQLMARGNEFLCDVGLQCLAKCHTCHPSLIEPFLENLVPFTSRSRLRGLGSSPGLGFLGKVRESPNYQAGAFCPSHRKGIVGRFPTPCGDGNQVISVDHRW